MLENMKRLDDPEGHADENAPDASREAAPD
jgi:hypothetical protein